MTPRTRTPLEASLVPREDLREPPSSAEAVTKMGKTVTFLSRLLSYMWKMGSD